MKLTFRIIRKTDFSSCAKLLIESFKEEPWNEKWKFKKAYNRIDELMSSCTSRGYVIIDDKKVVGMCIGEVMTYAGFKELWIDEFSINPAYQRKGLGSKLLAFVKKELTKEQIDHISLATGKDYPAAKFYEKNGFKVNESTYS